MNRTYRVLVVVICVMLLIVPTACASPVEKNEPQQKSTQIQLQQIDESAGIVVWNDEEDEGQFYMPSGPTQGLLPTEPSEPASSEIVIGEMPTYTSNLTLREFDIYRQTDEVWKHVGRIEERGCAVMSVCTVMSGYNVNVNEIKDMVYGYKSGGCAPVAMFQDKGIEAYYFRHIDEDDIVRRMLQGEVFIIHEGPGRWTDSSHYMPLLDLRTNKGRYEVYVGNTVSYGKTGWVSLSSVLEEAEGGYGIYQPSDKLTIHQ